MYFNKLFEIEKPIIGMIHLAGENQERKISRALEELTIYEQEGINGAIIEDYHGNIDDVESVLIESQGKYNLRLGINVLRNPYRGFELASKYGGKFVQFDSVQTPDLNLSLYKNLRQRFSDIAVLGGVRFKYVPPTGNSLEDDLRGGKSRCEAIVTTGDGTGIETPIKKLKQFKDYLKDFPLIVGAGVNLSNVEEQLQICDGAIIGSYFKPWGNTKSPVDRIIVRNLMSIVKTTRN